MQGLFIGLVAGFVGAGGGFLIIPALLFLAKTPGAPAGTKGLSLFIVPKIRLDGKANDVVCTKIEEKMGIHGQATCEMTFGSKGECVGVLIGKEFEGMIDSIVGEI